MTHPLNHVLWNSCSQGVARLAGELSGVDIDDNPDFGAAEVTAALDVINATLSTGVSEQLCTLSDVMASDLSIHPARSCAKHLEAPLHLSAWHDIALCL